VRYIDRVIIIIIIITIIIIIIINADGSVLWDLRLFYCLTVGLVGGSLQCNHVLEKFEFQALVAVRRSAPEQARKVPENKSV